MLPTAHLRREAVCCHSCSVGALMADLRCISNGNCSPMRLNVSQPGVRTIFSSPDKMHIQEGSSAHDQIRAGENVQPGVVGRQTSPSITSDSENTKV